MHAQVRLFILSTQFLTRLPTPQVADFRPEDLARSALWFPAVGLLIGALLLAATWLGAQLDPWLGALFGLLAWVWVTGGLHLDGLADLADGLGAAHRDPARLLALQGLDAAGIEASVRTRLEAAEKPAAPALKVVR